MPNRNLQAVRAVFLAVLIVPFMVVAVHAGGGPKFRTAVEKIPNEYIVVLNETPRDLVPSVAMELALRYGGRLMGIFKYGVQGFGIELPEQAAIALSEDPLVSFVEENGLFHLSYAYLQEFSNDEYWHLDRIDNQYSIYEYKAYAYTSIGSDVNAYIIDTGIQAKHIEFDFDGNPDTAGSRVTAGADFYYEGGSITPSNPCGGYVSEETVTAHGTAVASLIGGLMELPRM